MAPVLIVRRIIRGRCQNFQPVYRPNLCVLFHFYRGRSLNKNENYISYSSVMSKRGSLILALTGNGSEVVGLIPGIIRRSIENGASYRHL